MKFTSKGQKTHFLLLLTSLLLLACSPSDDKQDLRILFIGNSYTYYNSSPEILKAFIQERFPEKVVKTKLISAGGMTLSRHWQNEEIKSIIQNGDWDFVVLQEQSRLGMNISIDETNYFGPTDQFFKYARLFNNEIISAGAETVFLMTWSQQARPEEQVILTHAYASIARELGAKLAPVGMVWDKLRTNEMLNLYNPDGSHPSAEGSYLLASTLYATVIEDDPNGLAQSISGQRLASSGEPSSDQQLLVNISPEEAAIIQETSWEVVKTLQHSQGYPETQTPAPFYTIPTLSVGQDFGINDIIGTWYGTSTYGFDYIGQVMQINEKNELEIDLSFYSPHLADKMTFEGLKTQENQWDISIFDPFRNRISTITLTMDDGQLKGLLQSGGDFAMYKHINFSRNPMQNKIDLARHAALIDRFEKESLSEGYVSAAIGHYQRFSQLTGHNYQPEEFYLNAMGYNFLREDQVADALDRFALALHYYPKSVNAYDSYAEALIAADRKQEAYGQLKQAYALAKQANDPNLSYIEANMIRLENDLPTEIAGGTPPPPPPPPPSGGTRH